MVQKKRGAACVRWSLTYNAPKDSNPLDYRNVLGEWFGKNCENYVFQLEQGEQGTQHFQISISLTTKKRKSTILAELFKGALNGDGLLYVEPSHNWSKSFDYCMKGESRVEGPWSDSDHYLGEDLQIFNQPGILYPYQEFLMKMIDLAPHPTRIIQVVDPKGVSGKSAFIKKLCFSDRKNCIKVPIAGALNTKASLIDAGKRRVYLLDIPRTLGSGERREDVLSVIEELKTGHLVSAFYGRYKDIYMAPPHVIVFLNTSLNLKGLSAGRWRIIDLSNGHRSEVAPLDL